VAEGAEHGGSGGVGSGEDAGFGSASVGGDGVQLDDDEAFGEVSREDVGARLWARRAGAFRFSTHKFQGRQKDVIILTTVLPAAKASGRRLGGHGVAA
jgi:hypothetical protein